MESVKKTEKQPPLRLPFEHRTKDAGEWAFDHRVGLCVTLIAYLLAGIVFVSARLAIGGRATRAGIYIEMQDNKPLPLPEQRPLERIPEQDLSDVRNRISNENATTTAGLNERLRDDRGTAAADLYNEAEKLQERIRSNREAYERGLGEDRAIASANTAAAGDKTPQDVKIKGRVTVAYSFSNPVRTAIKPVVPAYQCEGGGEVIVSVTVNRNGVVTAASVDRASSSTDRCMWDTALAAAKASRFNVDSSAPERHNGTIDYIFIPQ